MSSKWTHPVILSVSILIQGNISDSEVTTNVSGIYPVTLSIGQEQKDNTQTYNVTSNRSVFIAINEELKAPNHSSNDSVLKWRQFYVLKVEG